MEAAVDIDEIRGRWPDRETAVSCLEGVRWPEGVVCPYCGSRDTGPHEEKRRNMPRHQCRSCQRSFSVTVGTAFHHTHLPLQTWFLALAVIMNAEKKVPSRQMARELDVSVKTAWKISHRIQSVLASDPEQQRLFRGIVGRGNAVEEIPAKRTKTPRRKAAPPRHACVADSTNAEVRADGSGSPHRGQKEKRPCSL